MKNQKEETEESTYVQLYEYPDYEINSDGHIKSKEREGIDSSGRRYKFNTKILKPRNNKLNPHEFVEIIYDDNGAKKKKTIYVHKAVAEHFLDAPREDQVYILHKDGNHTDNSASNLKWATKEELAKIHHETRVRSTRQTWITRRKLYGDNGIKSTGDEQGSK